MDANAPAADSRWQDLLAAGFRPLRDLRRYGWFIALSVAGSVVFGLTSRSGDLGILGLPVVLLSLYLILPLARQMLTGRLAVAGFDGRALLRLIGFTVLLVLVSGPVALVGLAGGWTGFVAAAALAALLFLAMAARLSFYVPALSVGDPTGLAIASAQGRPYWRSLFVVTLLTAGIGAAASALLPFAPLPALLADLLDGLVNGVASLVGVGAVCDLYGRAVARAAA